MSDRIVRSICQRLSLRKPQTDSLEILADVLKQTVLSKDSDITAALEVIRDTYSRVESFEHAFPSLCFELATGVGKTRLMGAFIAYLYLAGKSRHFFLLAPNKTIYDKLITDFTAGTPKYVFKGIAEFAAKPPLIVTGDNYESGIGIRFDANSNSSYGGQGEFFSDVHINIFNVDKINKEEGPRGKPRMKRLQETIGESYYAYLSHLDDLVLLMDEAHRYRASAGASAIDGLKPILGLELTATPKTVGARSVPFRNVIYDYTLGQAMADGFVKEPAVATRKDFDPRSVSEQELERIKLEDAVHYHDHVAVELDRYHHTSGAPKIKPFILVVAVNTADASRLRTFIESEDFFKRRFKGKVAEVHSALRGEESDDATQRLLALETDGRTEIVIHVNKLKEGWDVSNLYTIVPLRASASDILTEQTLGRGLRLPFGKRVSKGGDDDFAAVDRLTVIAHDRFDDIIAKAREPGSIVMKPLEIGEGGDIPGTGSVLVTAPSVAEMIVTGAHPEISGFSEAKPPTFVFRSPEEGKAAEVTLDVIRRYERKLGSAEALRDKDVQKQIADEVRELVQPAQGTLEGVVAAPRINEIVGKVAETVADRIISIPQIVVLPKKHVTFTFEDFDLVSLDTINMRPIDEGLIIEDLRTQARVTLARAPDDPHESHPEDYLVRYLIERNEIDYDAHAALLYKLAGQVVVRVGSYLTDDAEVENVLLRHGRELADFIFAQMMEHYRETVLDEDDYEVRITRGFTLLQAQPMNVIQGLKMRDFQHAVTPLSETRKQVFGAFTKCCYPLQKFDTDPERRLAVTIDRDPSVEKWLKPGRNQFRIDYRSGEAYEPDFVVETDSAMLILEVKAQNELGDPLVKAKAVAATKWCRTATAHVQNGTGKPWTYALIPDDKIIGSSTLAGLVAKFRKS
ncbi:type III restriction endonuclease subunit R [Gluconobacter oxydans]|uniref:DEAD/DEAH box helicase family protein n=1 Tax=Gluconobacter oxydans TaxID=442 RepID=A0AB35AQ79_GLUOY|nr:DEAD/DEAH box helicase family protein [Gluconobacter oxydans]KXV35442.1 restriction endonuclease subunit R [Gluconobacter oxydans]MBF0856988.1 DEAD/DEAH box helicase family protein [Gluconobacter oxydans]TCW23682.1 type III restriction enzyme [Gluconobacter oxydans]GEC61732.1 type III restriction endonuclease subunit R [Gluconobacter oxydans]